MATPDHIPCVSGGVDWSAGSTRVAEVRVAEDHVLGLRARLEQPPEAVGVLDGLDHLVALGLGHVGVGGVVDAPDGADGDRLRLALVEGGEVVLVARARGLGRVASGSPSLPSDGDAFRSPSGV